MSATIHPNESESHEEGLPSGAHLGDKIGNPQSKPHMSNKHGKDYCAIYARTSKDDGEGVSIPQQVDSGRDKARQIGLEVYKVYIDRDVSGDLPPKQIAPNARKTRPALTQLINDASHFSTVIARKGDRLGRMSVGKGLDMLSLMTETHGLRLRFTHDADTDLTTASGEFNATLQLATARLARRQIQDNIKVAKEFTYKMGMWNGGKVPLGFSLSQGKLVVSPEAVVVNELYRMYDDGKSLGAILRLFREKYKGMRKWGHSALAILLRQPMYIGKVRFKETLIKCPDIESALLDEGLWWRVQNKLNANAGTRGSPKGAIHPVSSVIRCGGCGFRMRQTLTKMVGVTGYFCTCKMPNKTRHVREDEYIALLRLLLSDVRLVDSPRTIELRLKIMRLQDSISEGGKRIAAGDMTLSMSEYMDLVSGLKKTIAQVQHELDQEIAKSHTAVSGSTPVDMSLMDLRLAVNECIKTLTVYRKGAVVEWREGTTVLDSVFPRLWIPLGWVGKRLGFLPLNYKSILHVIREYMPEETGLALTMPGYTWEAIGD